MKVLFIFPNYDCPIGISIGVSYLSAILKEKGHITKIIHINEQIDYCFDIERIISDAKDFEPALVAISVGENHYKDMCELVKRMKTEIDAKYCMGGIHITVNAYQVMGEINELDYCILGDGEEPLIELVDSLEEKKDVTNIPNVWVRKGTKIIKNRMRPLKQMFSLPSMDLEGWQFEKITQMRHGWINVSMNRGCPYRCSYCHNIAEVKVLQENFETKGTSNKELGYLRLRDVDDMIRELRDIKTKYPYIKEISFIDDTFTFNKEHMLNFFKKYAQEIGLPFVCLTTVNDLDEELLDAMKDANCDMIRFGVESASENIRKKIIRRNFSNEKMYKVFRMCKDRGIRTFAYNMIAHPGETKDEIISTLKVNAELKPEGVRISLGYPYKGTLYYEIANEMGLIDNSKEFHNYSTDTKFIFSQEDRLWIDKVRLYFKWWLNMFLENESSEIYHGLIAELEKLTYEEWNDESTRKKISIKDREISEMLKNKNIEHYTSPYYERPDIIILYKAGSIMIKREELDEH